MRRTLLFLTFCAVLLLWTARTEAQVSVQIGVAPRPYSYYYGPGIYYPARPLPYVVVPPPPHHHYRPAPPPHHHYRHPGPPHHHRHHHPAPPRHRR